MKNAQCVYFASNRISNKCVTFVTRMSVNTLRSVIKIKIYPRKDRLLHV